MAELNEILSSGSLEINEVPHFQGCLNIGGYNINIFSPFEFPKLDSYSYQRMGVPECNYNLERDVEGFRVVFIHSATNLKYDWYPNQRTVVIKGNKEEFSTGTCLLFAALSCAEYQRQLKGQFLFHGAAVELPSGRSLLILGHKGEGKTSLLYNLCRYHQCKLIANDLVYVRTEGDALAIDGGTKDLNIRESATKTYLKDLSHLFSNGVNSSWNNKRSVEPSDLEVSLSTEQSTVLESAVWIHLDPHMQEAMVKRKLNVFDRINNLHVAELVSRHISGITTPLMNDNGEVVMLSPSFDDEVTRQNRLKMIKSMFAGGAYHISGGNIDEITNYIFKEIV